MLWNVACEVEKISQVAAALIGHCTYMNRFSTFFCFTINVHFFEVILTCFVRLLFQSRIVRFGGQQRKLRTGKLTSGGEVIPNSPDSDKGECFFVLFPSIIKQVMERLVNIA